MAPPAATESQPIPGGGLLHPVPIVAIALLVLNDHWLKGMFPGWWTGKLSDFAGMIFFPLMLQAGWEVIIGRFTSQWGPSRRVLWGCVLATAFVFGGIQMIDVMAESYRWGLGFLQWPFRLVWGWISANAWTSMSPVAVTQDPTDLVAVPFVLVALMAGWSRSMKAVESET